MNGRKLEQPRCSECHEEAVRLWTRFVIYDAADVSEKFAAA